MKKNYTKPVTRTIELESVDTLLVESSWEDDLRSRGRMRWSDDEEAEDDYEIL